MILARVDGNITSTVCHPTLRGWRLLILQGIDEQGREKGDPVIAIDEHGAGFGDRVFYTTDGSSTREHVGNEHSPLRNMVMGIID
ncbi:EutN/CcmL family microcompartment protein [Ruficoccus amylovorans]|uniref:EutN/CcmL family microcompartment protein n=1 Tax=Ruficoccus amylovorans TaxID=1804625 RepID=A0A842HAN7_9BACT|nr:EutN/CcmL family microcompartment protein [Ruficoccus amylovorans]MBC2593148.1 EutN/CcmL family microcompartment protein [Ruficoccus amylovorans]